MESEAQASVDQGPLKIGPNPKRNFRRKQPQHSADIVYTKGATLQTLPSLSKLLKGVTECVIGLQYVWEYRSPSKSVPPHYQCKLCAVSRLQHDMLAHVKGWKHSFRYLKKVHPDKVTQEEEEAVKDPVVRKAIKEVAAEVEKTEGRGQLKVILKEPCEVPAFRGLRSVIPKLAPPLPPPPPPGMGLERPPFGQRFLDPRFPGEYPHPGGPHPDFAEEEYGEPGFGDYSARHDFLDPGMDQGPFPESLGPHPAGDGFGPGGGRDSYGRSGRLDDRPNRMYPHEYQTSQMDRPMDRPMDKPVERPALLDTPPENGNPPNTLLSYLDTFRIENENDAQLVLKVTQKLTDVLMDYRLRSVSAGSTLTSFSMNSTNLSSTSSRLSGGSDRFSNSFSGPSRYAKGPSRFYK